MLKFRAESSDVLVACFFLMGEDANGEDGRSRGVVVYQKGLWKTSVKCFLRMEFSRVL